MLQSAVGVCARKQHGSKTGAQNHCDISAPRQSFLNVWLTVRNDSLPVY